MTEDIFDKFSDPKLVEILTGSITKKAQKFGQLRFMEVCGTHTMSIGRYGLKDLLPENIDLLSGPGCPVCVTHNVHIDKMIALARIPGNIIATFGDMLRVPGSTSSLNQEMANGADVRVIYSPLDAVNIAIENPDKNVVFIGIGFETTAPTTAIAIKQAKDFGLKNFSVLSAHKNMIGALESLVSDSQTKIDGLILPGHVCVITGYKCFEFLSEKYKTPGVVSGFEIVDILQAIDMLLDLNIQKAQRKPIKIKNAYTRLVSPTGNKQALGVINEVFDLVDSD